MSKILVTGGAGFIGSHLTDALVLAGNDVVVIDDMSGGNLNNLNPEVHSRGMFYKNSVCYEREVNDIFGIHKFDIVYHLAAYAAECLSPHIKRFNYMNNLIGSVNLINASVNHGVKCFVFTSSAAVYGDPGSSRINEYDSIMLPEDSYGIAKLAVERELRITQKLFGLDYVIFRPHNLAGERQNLADRYRNVIGIWMNQIMRGEPMTIFGDGSQTRCFTYVRDIIPVLVSAPSNALAIGCPFNLGSDDAIRVLDLARMVAKAMGVECNVKHLPPRHEVYSVTPSHHELKQTFGDQPHTPIKEWLSRMAQWAKTVGPQEPSRFGAIEIEKNLPESWREK